MIKTYLDKMIESQITLNDKLIPNWRSELSLDQWNRAIVCELGEALASTKYKWWKQSELDESNIVVECIDIIHFGISYATKFYENEKDSKLKVNEVISRIAENIFNSNDKDKMQFTNDEDKSKVIESYIDQAFYGFAAMFDSALLESFDVVKDDLSDENATSLLFQHKETYLEYGLSKIFVILKLLGLTFEDVFKKFMMKNTLNHFRYDNGYQDGSYDKIWFTPNKHEDNEIAVEYADKRSMNPNFSEDLYKYLTDIYNSHLENKGLYTKYKK